MRFLYVLLLHLLAPILLVRQLWRSRTIRGYRERIPERFGFVPQPPQGVAVWVHAVSVGESLAALPLIRRLIDIHGEHRVWVTATTPTGSERVIEALGQRVIHTYAPYDLPSVVSRFLDRVRPAEVVIMETELWPSLFRELSRRRIPLVIANARLSPDSFRRYSRVSGFAHSVLGDTTLVAAQSELDATRFRDLGAPNVIVLGNLKFDVDPPMEQLTAGRALRARLGESRPVWIAASTHEGEESAALAAHALIREQHPDAMLILVPRHPQRFDEVARVVEKSGLGFERRSALSPDVPAAVLLGDSLGEMWMYLAAADVAFVGGSLVDIGGHNVLEPAALALPVLFGPHMHNFLAARELLLEAGAAEQLDEGTQLPHHVLSLLSDAPRRARMGEAGSHAVLVNRGALARLMTHLAS